MTIKTGGVTGQQIVDAVRSLAGNGFVEKKSVVEDLVVLTIGRSSDYPYEDVIILVDGSTKLELSAQYTQVSVVATEWPGSKYAVGYSDDSVINSVRKFRDQLEKKLI